MSSFKMTDYNFSSPTEVVISENNIFVKNINYIYLCFKIYILSMSHM